MNDSADRARFDFDAWSTLAREDPEAFEARRMVEIQAIIEAASPEIRTRLEALQWRVDRVRDRSGSPMGACIALSRLMWERVNGPAGLVESLQSLRGEALAPHERPKAAVVPLGRARGSDGVDGR